MSQQSQSLDQLYQSLDQSSGEPVDWNSLQSEVRPTQSGNLGWFFVRLAAVVFCAIALYIFGGLGGAMAALVAGWFVLYKN